MNFNFTSTPKTTGGFTLNMNPSTTTSTSLPFGSGAGDAKIPNKTTADLYVSSVSVTSAPLNFVTTGSPSALGFGAGPTTNVGSTGINFEIKKPAFGPTSTVLSFGATTSASVSSSFGTATVSTAPLNFSSTTTSFSLGTTAASTSTPQFGFGAKTTSSASSTFTPLMSSTTTSSGINLGSTTATSTSTSVSLSFGGPTAPTTTATSSTASLGFLPTSTLISTSTTSSGPSTGCMTFSQLEDSINKWTIDLEEQGKFFINQAKQLNAWDSLLISNGGKILNLNSSIERVKQQQQQLDQELDFVLAQQKELEELIRPLEKELVDIPVTDIDRNQMYQFAEIIDSQLKQMSDDLKEIIEHINDSNKDEEITNPVSQISRILNAHMNSLQWIDRNTAQISAHLEQITKIQDSNRRNFALNHSLNHSFNM